MVDEATNPIRAKDLITRRDFYVVSYIKFAFLLAVFIMQIALGSTMHRSAMRVEAAVDKQLKAAAKRLEIQLEAIQEIRNHIDKAEEP